MTRIAALLAAARQRIPASEARLLLGHVLGRNGAWLEAHRDDEVDVASEFFALVERRAAGEPIAYLTGLREFYGRDLAVTPAVLIPRPETELLVDIAKQKLGAGPPQADARPPVGGSEPILRAWGATELGAGPPQADARPPVGGSEPILRAWGATELGAGGTARILDLGTGSGCLAVTLALELPRARVTAVDVSPAALEVARRNARRLGASVDFVESDWFSALPPERFDFIVANPPYVAAGDPHLDAGDLRCEPVDALTDHADGMAAIRLIVTQAPGWLADGGWLFFEHGYDHAAAARQLLEAAGFAEIEQQRDLAGIVRASGGRYCISRE